MRFREVGFLLSPASLRTTPFGSRLRAVEATLNSDLGDSTIDAPWRKLVIRIGSGDGHWFSPETVVGVRQADHPARLAPYMDVPEDDVRRLACGWIREAIAHAPEPWGDPVFDAALERVARTRGLLVNEPISLRVSERGKRGREYRVRFERDESGMAVYLVLVDPSGATIASESLATFDRRWDGGFDFLPRKLRLTPETVELLDVNSRIIKSIPRSNYDSRIGMQCRRR